MPKAGFCSECNANVWLNPDGSCPSGHPRDCVSGVYEAPAPAPQPESQPAPAPKSRAGLVIGIVVGLVVALMLCGILSAIAVPVFLNASSDAKQKSCFANQRLVMGAAQTYLVMNEGATLAPDWSGLMSQLIPSVIKTEPKCPAGGVYSIEPSADGVNVTCSIHGSVGPLTTP